MLSLEQTVKIKIRIGITSNPRYIMIENQSGERHGPARWKAKDATPNTRKRGYNSIGHQWLSDPQYQESQCSRGWTLGYCKYPDYFKTVNVTMLPIGMKEIDTRTCSYFEVQRRKIQERSSKRDDFLICNTIKKSLALTRHLEGKEKSSHSEVEKRKQIPLDEKLRSTLEWRSWNYRKIWIAGIFIFDNLVGTTRTVRTTRLTRMTGMERMSTYFLSSQVTLQLSLPVRRLCFFWWFHFQTWANVVHATVSEDRTSDRTHHRLKFFSCARLFINAHALIQGQGWVEHSSLRFSKVILSSHVSSQPARCPWSSFALSYRAGFGIRHNLRRSTERFMVWPNGWTELPHRLWAQGLDRDLQRAHADQLPFKKEQFQHRHERSSYRGCVWLNRNHRLQLTPCVYADDFAVATLLPDTHASTTKKCQWVWNGSEACGDLHSWADISPDFCEMKITKVSKHIGAMIGRDGYLHRWTALRDQFVKVWGRFNESSKSLVERLDEHEIFECPSWASWAPWPHLTRQPSRRNLMLFNALLLGHRTQPTPMLTAASELGLGIDVHSVHIISRAARLRTATQSNTLTDGLAKKFKRHAAVTE